MKGVFLVATCAFWSVQLAWPVFNSYFTAVYVTETHSVSVGNVLTPVFGFLSLLFAHCLRKTTTPTQNRGALCDITFLVFAYLIVMGHGIHLACVVIEDASEQVHQSWQPLVHFLHERVSHNVFQLGFYGMMALLSWEELSAAKSKTSKNADTNGAATITTCSGRLLGCALLGAFFSIFAAETSTQVVTVSFYALCQTMIFYAVGSFGFGGVWRLYLNSELLICVVLTQAALVGFIAMAFY